MKNTLIIFVVMILAIPGFVYSQSQTDFSGTWVLDPSKSELGINSTASQKNPMRKMELVLTQTDKQLTVKRSSGETAVYQLDGSESINSLPGGGQATTTMNWLGDTLVATTTSSIGEMNVEMVDVRSLDASGKVMNLKVTRQTPRGEVKQTLIYLKQ